MAYAARLVAKIHPAAYPAATPRAEPRRLSSLHVGKRVGGTLHLLLCCTAPSGILIMLPRSRRIRDRSRRNGQPSLWAPAAGRRRSPVYLVKLVGCLSLSHLPPSVTSLFFSLLYIISAMVTWVLEFGSAETRFCFKLFLFCETN